MNYVNLSKTRKNVVDLIMRKFPGVKESGTITFKELTSLFVNTKSYTDPDTNQKYGYPLWLTIEKEFRSGTRGMYKVPLPTLNDFVGVTSTKNEVLINSKPELTVKKKERKIEISDEEFLAELAEAGIEL